MKRFKSLSKTRRIVAVGLTVGLTLGVASAAFAYFTTTGSGTGSGTVGTATAMTINQASITYSNSPTNAFVPGTSATVTFTVDNPSSGNQDLGTISLASWASGSPLTCGSTVSGQSDWFTMTPDVVNTDYAPGNALAVTGNSVITFNNEDTAQNACAGQTITFTYSA
ncbi:MAG: hypothetical protein ABSA65_17665 [Acidimicrobiales bacterium]|jgi:hypothetical protein